MHLYLCVWDVFTPAPVYSDESTDRVDFQFLAAKVPTYGHHPHTDICISLATHIYIYIFSNVPSRYLSSEGFISQTQN